MAHVAEYKKKKVAELVKLMTDYPVIAVVSVEGVPAPQLQKVRAQIRDNVVMTMAKRRIIKIALENVKEIKKGIEKLKDSLGGMPALMFTKQNPFKLSATLMKSKSKAPAKAGQTAPNDIIVEAGPTSFAPGPIIGELGQLGIKTAVEDGKIAIKEDKVLVKKGEVVNENAAALLTRLEIHPMEIGLMPTAAYDNGTIFKGDVLAVDEKEYINKLNIADSEAFNLACEIKYPAKEVVEMLIGKAFNEAKAVGIEFKIIDKDVIDNLLGIAESEMLGLKETAGIEVPEKKKEIKEEKKEEVKVEEKKEEVKAERPKEEAKDEEKPEVKEEKKLEDVAEDKKTEIPKEEKPIGAPKEEVNVEEKEAEEVKAEEKKEIKEETKEEEKPAEKPKEEPIEEKKEEPVKEEVEKEEIKPEEASVEKKEENADEKAEEPKKEKKTEAKDDVDKKIEEMVQKTKDFTEGNIPSAEKLVDEVEEKAEKEKKENEEKVEEKKEEEESKKVPSAHELKEKQKEQSADSSQKPVYSEKRKKDEDEMKAVQDIVKKIQKGENV